MVTVQVVLALVAGLTLRSDVPLDLFHRIGFPFQGLGTVALFALVMGLVVVSLPWLLGEEVGYGHDRLAGVALTMVAVVAVVVAIGSVLAVRANLHLTNQPTVYDRVQLAGFLLGSLGAAALALFGALAARGHRRAERWED